MLNYKLYHKHKIFSNEFKKISIYNQQPIRFFNENKKLRIDLLKYCTKTI